MHSGLYIWQCWIKYCQWFIYESVEYNITQRGFYIKMLNIILHSGLWNPYNSNVLCRNEVNFKVYSKSLSLFERCTEIFNNILRYFFCKIYLFSLLSYKLWGKNAFVQNIIPWSAVQFHFLQTFYSFAFFSI